MMRKGLVAAGILAVVVVVVGYMAASSSTYMDVSELAGLKEPQAVMVKGRVVDIRIFAPEDQILFLLQGKDGTLARGWYSLSRFRSTYGGLPSHRTVSSEIVVKGFFYPSGETGVAGDIRISEILQGCHKAYETPMVSG